VSSGRDFNLGRDPTDTFDQLIRRRDKLKYFVTMGLFSKSEQLLENNKMERVTGDSNT
jgi:hypothetical protein